MRYTILAYLIFLTAGSAAAQSPQPYDWSGLYVGGHLGYANGGDVGAVPFRPAARRTRYVIYEFEGPIAGGQWGYNWHFTSGFVMGFEADASFASVRGAEGIATRSFRMVTNSHFDVSGTARARLGYAWENFLFYGSTGFAAAKHTISEETTGPDFPSLGPQANTRLRIGWTLGGGIEWSIAPRWSIKAEYFYTRYKPVSELGNIDSDLHIVRVGFNYHISDVRKWGR